MAHLLVLMLPAATTLCADDALRPVQSGVWGGDHIGVTVTESGAAVEHDCASGTVDEPLRTDARGRFEARGVHIPLQGGPTRPDDRPARHPARYTGTVDGQSMTLSILLTGTGESLGPFSLRRAAIPRIYRCL